MVIDHNGDVVPHKKPFFTKRSWSSDEDVKLKDLVAIHGTAKWATVAEALGGRSGKQCRERWNNHLNPDLRKGGWTKEEDEIILKLQARLGNQWAKMMEWLPGRSDNGIKNRWHSAMRTRGPTQPGDPGHVSKETHAAAAAASAKVDAERKKNGKNKSSNSSNAATKAESNPNNSSETTNVPVSSWDDLTYGQKLCLEWASDQDWDRIKGYVKEHGPEVLLGAYSGVVDEKWEVASVLSFASLYDNVEMVEFILEHTHTNEVNTNTNTGGGGSKTNEVGGGSSTKGGGSSTKGEKKKGTRKSTRSKKGGASVNDGPPTYTFEPLIILEDRSTNKQTDRQSRPTRSFFAKFHQGFGKAEAFIGNLKSSRKRMEEAGVSVSDVYQRIEPASIGFPETSIICKFVDGRYKIYDQGIIWSSIKVASQDLKGNVNSIGRWGWQHKTQHSKKKPPASGTSSHDVLGDADILSDKEPNPEPGDDEEELAKESSSGDLEEELEDICDPLIILEDRTRQTKSKGPSAQRARSAETRSFFAKFHQGYKPTLKGEVYQLIEPASIGLPETSIICRFVDGRYKIYDQGVVWSSINDAARDLKVNLHSITVNQHSKKKPPASGTSSHDVLGDADIIFEQSRAHMKAINPMDGSEEDGSEEDGSEEDVFLRMSFNERVKRAEQRWKEEQRQLSLAGGSFSVPKTKRRKVTKGQSASEPLAVDLSSPTFDDISLSSTPRKSALTDRMSADAELSDVEIVPDPRSEKKKNEKSGKSDSSIEQGAMHGTAERKGGE
ncbi:hypothetical protein TrCOL_g6199 [Triparma columacea]|uniref:Uncharacterized protein n=1 Tax=Triparma columacea TaxID=722753 RepID=A0A9W7L4B1_9STRA|nr:hypothetical protein TrCOL_g6199 [Triparma columacea]